MNTPTQKAYPILLAGGAGTRLWPVSRSLFPKQLVSFREEQTLIQETVQRLLPVFNLKKVITVCGREHYHETVKQLQAIGVDSEDSVICEPTGRNTAPAILLAAMTVGRRCDGGDAVLFVFPADHVIRSKQRFHEKIREAMDLAVNGHIVTFGIKPDYPETGYGYIEGGSEGVESALKIKRFVEKPDLKTAQSYLASGNFFWNSGMFAFRASVIMDEFLRLTPDMAAAMEKIIQKTGLSLAAYQALPNISFDYAIMEHTAKGVVLPSDFGWSDIGTWKSLYDFLPKDTQGNVIRGDVIASRTQESLLLGQSRLVVSNDVKKTVVVETPDAVFVSSLKNSRDVKNIVESLKRNHRKEYQSHTSESHQWGTLRHLEQNSEYSIAEHIIRKNETFRFSLNADGCCHVFVLRGYAGLSLNSRQQIHLKPFQSKTLFGPEEIAVKNKEQDEVAIVIILPQQEEKE
ncbi:MAG: mannose-1-phosphate guanylyltransferase/mannose-6-phosphate isomerase [Deltaproteobacteria bacterium]